MRLPAEFLRLPLSFDAERLQAEIDAVPADDWQPHPQGFPGNDALILVSVAGSLRNDDLAGPMRPTPALARCAYLRQVMASFRTVIGRSRLMRIAGSAEASPHFDLNYYWHQRMRIHVPIRTHPDVRFHCGDESVHMGPGECWVFDTWKTHKVTNPADYPRVHLVCDTVGSGPFWDLLAGSRDPSSPGGRAFEPRPVPFRPDADPVLQYESFNAPPVMTPWEQESLLANLLDDLAAADPPQEVHRQFQARLERFRFQWRGLWARFGPDPAGHAAYRHALDELSRQLRDFAGQLQLANGADPVDIVARVVIERSLGPGAESGGTAAPEPPSEPAGPERLRLQLRRPVIVGAAPRSGSTLLFEALSASPDLVSIGGESHGVIESIDGLDPSSREDHSNALGPEDADPGTVTALRQRFLEAVVRHEPAERLKALGPELRLLEKTPKNALRIGFFEKVFPAARYVYLVRDPRENISSIIDAWRSGRFVTYPELPGWNGPPWSLLLIPGWKTLPADDVAAIAAHQWRAAHEAMLERFEQLPAERVVTLRYESLRVEPEAALKRLCAALNVAIPDVEGALPLSRHTLTPPDPDKWRRNADDLERVLPMVEDTRRRIEEFLQLRTPV
ncbi:MAG: sulfotransferase [Candidatus Wenzhouxiangella sp. M2_3B_020]